MSGDLLIDLGYMLQASKRLDYRSSTKKMCHSFVEFLQGQGLVRSEVIRNGEGLPEDFKLFESDLTEQGVQYVKKVYLKWVGRVDKGADPEDSTYLVREYDKMFKV